VAISDEAHLRKAMAHTPSLRVIDRQGPVITATIDPWDLRLLRQHEVSFDILSIPQAPAPRKAVGVSGVGVADPIVQTMVNAVSEDSLVRTIGALQGFVTRYEYTPQQESAAEYIFGEFQRWGLQVEYDHYAFLTTSFRCSDAVGDTVWVAAYGSLLRSVDGGQHWSLQYGPLGNEYVRGIDFLPGGQGWAVGDSRAFIHTSDAGETWELQNIGNSTDIDDVAFFDERSGVAVGERFLWTSDGGASWQEVSSRPSGALGAVVATDSATLWAVGEYGAVYHSTDRGLTWLPQSLPDTPSGDFNAVHFADASHGWIVGYPSMAYKTGDGGARWERVSQVYLGDIRGVVVIDSSTVLMMSINGNVDRTTDGGVTWSRVARQIQAGWRPSMYGLVRSGSGRMLAYGGALLLSDPDGLSWVGIEGNLPDELLHRSRNVVATIPGSVTPQNECVIVAHYDSYGFRGLTEYAPGANDNASGTSAVMEAARICSNYRFESTLKFLAVSGEELGMKGSAHYVNQAVTEGRAIVGAVNGDMIGYPTTGDSARLIAGSYGFLNRLVDSAVVYNQRYAIGLNLETFIDNSGASDYGPFAIAGFDALDIGEDTPSAIWGGADPFYHTDSDLLENLYPGLVRRGAQLMLAVVAEMAVPLGPATTADRRVSVPSEFALEQNYPNPFNPRTTVRFEIPVSSRVSILVFNELGQMVELLVNDSRDPGSYDVGWDASGFPSGVYFCRLQAGGHVMTRKMLLVR